MKSGRRAIAAYILTGLVLAGLIFVAVVVYNPFFFAQKGTALYLRRNGVQSHYVMVDGYRIHYYEALPPAGSPDRPPLLLVHGLGASAGDWTSMLPGLARAGYHVYAPDLLGYGSSARPRDASYSLEQETQITTDFARTEGLKFFDLGGWSMGGWIALKMTLNHPKDVHRLVLFDAAGIYFPVDFPFDLFTPSDAAGIDRLVNYIEPNVHFIHIPGWATMGLLRRYREVGWVSSRSFASMLSGRELLDFRIRALQQPTLIVWGTEDKLIPYNIGQRMFSLLPNSTLVGVEGCGHLAPAECSSEVVPETVRFLGERIPPSHSERVIAKPR
jgi:abhydrolase domain-containing protein 6